MNYLPITLHHISHYKTSMNIFINNKINGSGVNSFRKVCNEDKYFVQNGCSTHPHNFYVQILAELGCWILFLFSFHVFIFYKLIIYGYPNY